MDRDSLEYRVFCLFVFCFIRSQLSAAWCILAFISIRWFRCSFFIDFEIASAASQIANDNSRHGDIMFSFVIRKKSLTDCVCVCLILLCWSRRRFSNVHDSAWALGLVIIRSITYAIRCKNLIKSCTHKSNKRILDQKLQRIELRIRKMLQQQPKWMKEMEAIQDQMM